MKKYLNFHINKILENPREQWNQLKKQARGKARVAFRKLDVDWQKYNTKDYLFTHDSICCSVATEDNGYWLKPACYELVNANGNAWTTPVLLGCFKTFIGGENYLQHMQIESLSKGKILDAVIRPAKHHSEKYNEDADIYIVDILVATNRKHANLIDRIESGKLSTLSMGCLAQDTTCSICGKVIKDGDKNCQHIDKHLGKMVTCSDGKQRICAELCGSVDENGNYNEGSCTFIQASWVENPAWQMARLNYFVQTPEQKVARQNDRQELAKLFQGNLFERLKVADTDSKIAIKITKEYAKEEKIAKKIIKDLF